MRLLKIIYAYIYKYFLTMLSYRFQIILDVISILGITFVFFYIGRIFQGYIPPTLAQYGEYFPFVITGFAFMGYLNVGLSSFPGTIQSEQFQGTLEATISSGASPYMLSVATPFPGYIRTTIRIVFYLLIAYLFLGMPVMDVNVWLLLLTVVISLLPYTGLGMISGAFIIAFKRGNPVSLLYGGLSMLISGVYFPYEMLPTPIQFLAELFPLTHTLKAIRLVLLKGAGFYDVFRYLIILLIMGGVFLGLGFISIRYAHRKALKDGSYTHY
jgi:ABC-2 type transport system permease protein